VPDGTRHVVEQRGRYGSRGDHHRATGERGPQRVHDEEPAELALEGRVAFRPRPLTEQRAPRGRYERAREHGGPCLGPCRADEVGHALGRGVVVPARDGRAQPFRRGPHAHRAQVGGVREAPASRHDALPAGAAPRPKRAGPDPEQHRLAGDGTDQKQAPGDRRENRGDRGRGERDHRMPQPAHAGGDGDGADRRPAGRVQNQSCRGPERECGAEQPRGPSGRREVAPRRNPLARPQAIAHPGPRPRGRDRRLRGGNRAPRRRRFRFRRRTVPFAQAPRQADDGPKDVSDQLPEHLDRRDRRRSGEEGPEAKPRRLAEQRALLPREVGGEVRGQRHRVGGPFDHVPAAGSLREAGRRIADLTEANV
jgi:hypothetical protein